MHALWAEMLPLWAEMHHPWSRMQPLWVEMQPLWVEKQPLWVEMQPLWVEMQPLCIEMQPLWVPPGASALLFLDCVHLRRMGDGKSEHVSKKTQGFAEWAVPAEWAISLPNG